MVTARRPSEEPPGQSSSDRPVEALELIGGELCLDFTNTVGGSRENPKERLHDYSDLVRWAAHAGAIGAEEADELLTRGAERPDAAEGVFARALELREAIYRIFDRIARGQAPAAADLERLNAELEPALGRLRVAPAPDGGFDLRFADEPILERVLWPLARSAAELLVSDDLGRVKQCGGDDCAWIFLDQSKNRSRRWCDMADCGNRAKARRHYRRRKRAAS